MIKPKHITSLLGNRKIFLTGFMGTGKTVIGLILHGKLRIPFYDLDWEIEDKYQRSISDIFIDEGEKSFRCYESDMLDEIISKIEPAIISLGGGALKNKSVRARVRSLGILITLLAEPVDLLPRLHRGQRKTLFIMTGKSADDIDKDDVVLDTISKLMKKREKIYKDCDFSVFTGGKRVLSVANEILKKLELHLAQ